MNDKPILVLGGTGHFGRHIVRSLLEKGESVRVLSRDAAKAHLVLGDQLEIVEGDITQRESVVEAVHGAKAIVIAVAAQVLEDHKLLLDTFSYKPTTLEMEAQRWGRQ